MSTPEGYLKDAQGRLVPREMVKAETLLEDDLVRRMTVKALEASGALVKFRKLARGEVQALLDVLAQQYGVARGGSRGNVTLNSFDGQLRIQLAISDTRSLGPQLQAAKALIDECLRDWADESRAELRALIEDVFQVGKTGRVDVDRILSLRKHDIKDERWQRAMTAISDALRIDSSKEHIRFYVRPSPDQDFIQIPLDVARV